MPLLSKNNVASLDLDIHVRVVVVVKCICLLDHVGVSDRELFKVEQGKGCCLYLGEERVSWHEILLYLLVNRIRL